MIDLHSHVLFGLDDGAETLADSVEMARAAVADGTTVLAGTPHVREDWPTRAEEMEDRVAAVRAALEREGVPLDVRPGGEIALDRVDALDRDELRRLGLGGNPQYLLVEFPYTGWPLGVEEQVFRLRTQGFTPVVAHPERNREVQARPERLEPLVRSGALVQLTAASVDGRLGRSSESCARQLLDLELAHLIASDAHMPSIRGIGMGAAARAVGDESLAQWLTVDVPRSIVDGTPRPPRPEREQRRGFLARLRK